MFSFEVLIFELKNDKKTKEITIIVGARGSTPNDIDRKTVNILKKPNILTEIEKVQIHIGLF